jgi:hypothetical protein
MALSDFLARATINPLSASISRLQNQITDAESDLDRKRAALDSLLGADGASIDGPQVVKADEAVAAAERRVKNLNRMLTNSQTRLAAQQADTERAEKIAKWQNAVKVAEKRHDHISQKLARSAEAFAKDYVEALALTNELYAALPAMPDPTAAMVDKSLVEIAVRKELLRRGASFAFHWPWGTVSLPEFVGQFSGALDVVRDWAERAKD